MMHLGRVTAIGAEFSGSSASLAEDAPYGIILAPFRPATIPNALPGTSADIVIHDGQSYSISGDFDNSGGIEMRGNTLGAELIATAATTLTGGGQIVLDNYRTPNSRYMAPNFIYGASPSVTLTNFDNTISGFGDIGDTDQGLGHASLILINDAMGVIIGQAARRDNAFDALVINANHVTNRGLIESIGADNHVGLIVRGTTVVGAGGVILATNGSEISLGADIVGGTLSTTGSGVIQMTYGELDGVASALHNAGTLAIDGADRTIAMVGTIVNTSTIRMLGEPGFGCNLEVAGTSATLTGGGQVYLASTANYVFGAAATDTLTNLNNTITGAGKLGGGGLTLINGPNGVIDATLVSMASQMYLDTGAGSIVNHGLIESTSKPGLVISGSTIINTGGMISAAPGASVTLRDMSLVEGGSLKIAAGATLDIDPGSIIEIVGHSTAILGGTIGNGGLIDLETGTSAATLQIGSNTTLVGAGTVLMGSGTLNRIVGATATTILSNQSTIAGAGHLGLGKLTLINGADGVIDATGTNALILNTGTIQITNAGTIEAAGSGGASILSAINNTGLLETAGGTLTVQGAVSGAGSAVIAGGAIDFTAAFSQAVDFTRGLGKLQLTHSQTYHAAVTGFSTSGGAALDLVDIGFVSAGEATFSGSVASGVLTVTDGSHVARIALIGNFIDSTFTASSDGHGGTIVVDHGAPRSASPQAFAAAIAALAPPPGTSGQEQHSHFVRSGAMIGGWLASPVSSQREVRTA